VTTVLADLALGLMVSDSSVSDGDRVWSAKKVSRIGSALIGFAGQTQEFLWFADWWKRGCPAEKPKFANSSALVLMPGRLVYFDFTCVGQDIKSGREAIGSGAKAAMCAYEALGWADPKRAVQIVCRHDNGSRPPVRVYRLKGSHAG
jgi:ATP-dependent protease HslVU (ClpYQ) peptidase subunit